MTAKTIRNVSKLNYASPFVTARRLHNSYDSGKLNKPDVVRNLLGGIEDPGKIQGQSW